MADKYPHFYAESHLVVDGTLFAALILYLALLPAGTASLIMFKLLTYLAGLRGSSLPNTILAVLVNGSAWELLLCAGCAFLAYTVVFRPAAQSSVSAAVVLYKRKVCSNQNQTSNQIILPTYRFYECCLIKNTSSFFFFLPAVHGPLGSGSEPP